MVNTYSQKKEINKCKFIIYWQKKNNKIHEALQRFDQLLLPNGFHAPLFYYSTNKIFLKKGSPHCLLSRVHIIMIMILIKNKGKLYSDALGYVKDKFMEVGKRKRGGMNSCQERNITCHVVCAIDTTSIINCFHSMRNTSTSVNSLVSLLSLI